MGAGISFLLFLGSARRLLIPFTMRKMHKAIIRKSSTAVRKDP